jgi:DNA-binding transcriptional LysR family regulator
VATAILPAAPERWQFIAFEQRFADMPQQSWLLDIVGNRPVVRELNHIGERLIAARAGVGVADLPCFLGESDRDLVRIHDVVPSFARDIWLVVHRDLRKTPMVRAVTDFVATVISENRDRSIR